jgi:hypothetical protein
MVDLTGREHRLLDLSKVRDNRYKGAGISVSDDNRARCTAELCQWIISANTDHGGTSPFPYGLYMLEGDPKEIQDLPADLKETPFLEVIPCDRPDRRAAKLTWNEAGTEAQFSFVALAATLQMSTPQGVTLWLDAIPVTDKADKPIMLLPLGDRIKRQAVQQVAAANQPTTPPKA